LGKKRGGGGGGRTEKKKDRFPGATFKLKEPELNGWGGGLCMVLRVAGEGWIGAVELTRHRWNNLGKNTSGGASTPRDPPWVAN